MAEAVLIINAGSSSVKFSLYRVGDDGEPAAALEGQIEGIGTEPHMTAKDAKGRELADRRWQDQGMDHGAFFRVLGQWLREQLGDTKLAGVGHRRQIRVEVRGAPAQRRPEGGSPVPLLVSRGRHAEDGGDASIEVREHAVQVEEDRHDAGAVYAGLAASGHR